MDLYDRLEEEHWDNQGEEKEGQYIDVQKAIERCDNSLKFINMFINSCKEASIIEKVILYYYDVFEPHRRTDLEPYLYMTGLDIKKNMAKVLVKLTLIYEIETYSKTGTWLGHARSIFDILGKERTLFPWA